MNPVNVGARTAQLPQSPTHHYLCIGGRFCIENDGDMLGLRRDLFKQFKPFRGSRKLKSGKSSNVPPGSKARFIALQH